MKMPVVSIVIVRKDNEDIIRDCLESAKWADEIVVVDAFSKDNTCETVSGYTDKIIKADPGLGSGKMWNLGIDTAKGEWIFLLESDKVIAPDLKSELSGVLRGDEAKEVDGYFIKTKNYFLGRWLKTGSLYPGYKLYIFKKGSARFEERHRGCLVFNGKSKKLDGFIEHYVYRSLEQCFSKVNHESDILADESGPGFKKRYEVFKPVKVFKKQYFRHGGSGQGMPELLFSFISAFESFLLYAKQWEKTLTLSKSGKSSNG